MNCAIIARRTPSSSAACAETMASVPAFAPLPERSISEPAMASTLPWSAVSAMRPPAMLRLWS